MPCNRIRNRDRLSVIFSYLVAAACVSGALLLREILNRQFGMSLVAVTFYPSVLVAALIEGLLPGLFATVLSTLLLWYLLLAPNFPPLPMGQGDMVNLIVFAAVNAGMAVLASNHRRLRLRARAEKQYLETVIGDLDHRLKHILSVAQAISRQVAERTDDVRQFQDVFQERLNSLTKSHKLLVDRKWPGVDITDLANAQLIPFNNAHQITTEGDTVFLNPTATQQIGLALYELASSSTKYGALKKGGIFRSLGECFKILAFSWYGRRPGHHIIHRYSRMCC
jgi:K+-sensing histidine kinase KdpD